MVLTGPMAALAYLLSQGQRVVQVVKVEMEIGAFSEAVMRSLHPS